MKEDDMTEPERSYTRWDLADDILYSCAGFFVLGGWFLGGPDCPIRTADPWLIALIGVFVARSMFRLWCLSGHVKPIIVDGFRKDQKT